MDRATAILWLDINVTDSMWTAMGPLISTKVIIKNLFTS